MLAIGLLISEYGKDWRRVPTKTDALDSPDDSLASLGRLNTLMSFGWSSPSVPETTLILQNDLALDEQLIASLPETPGVRYRVRKETAGSDTGVSKNKSETDNRLDESSQQVCVHSTFSPQLYCASSVYGELYVAARL